MILRRLSCLIILLWVAIGGGNIFLQEYSYIRKNLQGMLYQSTFRLLFGRCQFQVLATSRHNRDIENMFKALSLKPIFFYGMDLLFLES